MSASDDGAFGGTGREMPGRAHDGASRAPDLDGASPASGPGRSEARPCGRDRRAAAARRIAATIERDIVPRLVASARRGAGAAQIAGEVEQLVALVRVQDGAGARALLREAQARGMRVDEILTGMLAPAARRLGEMWEDDACDFAAVCLAVRELQQLLREVRSAIPDGFAPGAAGRRILLAAAPGEHHVFGVEMAAEAFVTAGWEVVCRPSASHAELVRIATRDWFDVAGFSLAAERHAGALADAIRAVRRVALNPGLVVIAGGPATETAPAAIAAVGADWIAADAGAAIARAGGAAPD